MLNEIVVDDGRDQLLNAAEDSSTQLLLGQFTEKTLDHVEPRGARRSELNRKPWVLGHSGLDFWMLVGRIVIRNQMNVLLLGSFPIDKLQELDPLLVAMLRHAGADHCPIQRVQCSK